MAKKILLLCSTIVLFSCYHPVPANISEIFSTWFINNDQASHKAIINSRITAKQLDSIVTEIRHKPTPTGAFSCKLYDPDGTESILGYATPKTIHKGTVYPLIVYLHGGIGTPLNNKGELAYDMFRFVADTVAMFLASPSASRAAPWWTEAGLNRILKTVRFMTLYYPIDPSRIFLAGVSDGAAGCYAAANCINGPFAGFIAVSGYGGILQQLGVRIYPSNMMQRPIYSVNGGLDHLYPQQVVQAFLNQLERNGVIIDQKFYPEQGHGFDYRENEKAAIAEIISTWKKPETANISWFPVDNLPNNTDNLLSWEACKEPATQITAWWAGDTLNVRPKGVCAFSMIAERKSLFLRSSDGKTERVKAMELNTVNYLMLMQHFCYPFVMGRNILYVEVN